MKFSKKHFLVILQHLYYNLLFAFTKMFFRQNWYANIEHKWLQEQTRYFIPHRHQLESCMAYKICLSFLLLFFFFYKYLSDLCVSSLDKHVANFCRLKSPSHKVPFPASFRKSSLCFHNITQQLFPPEIKWNSIL